MKYAVVTYIFGKNREILRKPIVRDDIEYICVTDQNDLKSVDWKIVYDEIPQSKCTRDKMVYVKYNPFKYTDADLICVIDGTLEITKSLIPLFQEVENKDILIKLHPERDNLYSELKEWINTRGMEKESILKFKIMGDKLGIDLNRKFLIESCVIVYTRSSKVKRLCEEEIAYMQFLGNNGNLFLSNQCVFTFLIQKKDLAIGFINQKLFFKRYSHNSNRLADR